MSATSKLLDDYRDAVLKATWTAQLTEKAVLGSLELRKANDRAEAARQAIEEHIEATVDLLAALKGILQALESTGSGYVFNDDTVLTFIQPALDAIRKAESV